VEPESRRAFRELSPLSLQRPAALRFRQRVDSWRAHGSPGRLIPRIPLRPDYLARVAPVTRQGEAVAWECATAFGLVPLELTEIYPVGPFLGSREFEESERLPNPSELERRLAARHSDLAPPQDWSSAWDHRQMRSQLGWVFGLEVADLLLAQDLRPIRSRLTGRLRGIRRGPDPAFVLGNDGVARPTWIGAEMLHPLLPGPRLRVVVHPDAEPFVAEGRTLFARFVIGADPSLVPGASALLVNREDALLAVGRLLMAPQEMGRLSRGIVAYGTSHARKPLDQLEDEGAPGLRIPPESPKPKTS
jgi:archaeosine-15-forming tRNA-guanine transglycosylase